MVTNIISPITNIMCRKNLTSSPAAHLINPDALEQSTIRMIIPPDQNSGWQSAFILRSHVPNLRIVKIDISR